MRATCAISLLLSLLAGCSGAPPEPREDPGGPFVIPAAPEATPPPQPLPWQQEMEREIAALDDDDASRREAAESALVAFGDLALARLDALAASPDPEIRARAASASRRIRLGDALWLADLVESNARKAGGAGKEQAMEELVAALRAPLEPVLADPKAYRRLLGNLFFAQEYMTDAARQARVDAVADAHPDPGEELTALLAESAKDPEFMDVRHRRAIAEIVRIHALGLKSDLRDVFYDALRPCGEWKDTQAALILPALAEAARRHADPERRGYARGYLLGMLAEGTDWAWGGVVDPWPGPKPHRSRIAAQAKDLLPWMHELASRGADEDRRWALRTIGHIADPSIAPEVFRAFHEDRAARSEALRALVVLGSPEAKPALLEILRNPKDPDLVPALHACAHLRPGEAHDLVAARFDDAAGAEAKQAATIALGAMARPDDLGRLATIFESWNAQTSVNDMIPVAGALLRIGPGDSPERRRIATACESLLKSDSGSVRNMAATVLESFDRKAGVRAWVALLDDGRQFAGDAVQVPVPWTAVGALERLTGQSFKGRMSDRIRAWKAWWQEHQSEYRD